MSLQEHYASASTQEQEPRRIHGVDICAPLVSKIQLPSGETLDLKTFCCETEFDKLRGIHENLRLNLLESIRIQEEEEQQRQREHAAAAMNELRVWYEQTPPTSPEREEDEEDISSAPPHQIRGAFGGCYDEEHYPDEHDDDNDNDNDSSSYDSDGETWDEEAIADEAEHRREVAQMKLDGDHPDVQQLEDIDIEVMEPRERFTASSAAGGGSMLSAQKKAAAGAAAKAAKARIAKQQQKKQQKKFVPVQITDNTNRTNEVTAILTANKLEINLHKKKLQNASREAVKSHNQKWNRVNALAKQSGARGTRIANIPEPRFDGDYSD
jgi:hypothetical protein